ncbi:oligosaccharide flippase family protein [Paenimyroides baculatum]|uniref:oligosaccharide flippase family protein n=1 Tax=Paenimyroides baculatum TaxID=2608000 RepID=UPI001680271E|nr:oligosaccharide flippase family protein [Paenimyroides baculatum]
MRESTIIKIDRINNLKNKIKKIFSNQFVRNVSTLAAGSIISQAVVVGTSPILSRLFTAESFGMLSIFTSITVFFAVVSTGRYELAIGLPRDEKKAYSLLKLILVIGLIISSSYFIVIFCLKNIFLINDSMGFLNNSTAYLAPFYIFLIAFYSGLGYILQRQKKYKIITIANAVQVISASLGSIAFGFLNIKQGLIYSLILGMFFAIIFVLKHTPEVLKGGFDFKEIKQNAIDYIDFPRYMIFSDLSLTASQQFIPILFSTLFSASIVGFYSMANRMIRLPNIVITSAVGNVFRNDAIEEIRLKGNCRTLYLSTLRKLIFISIPIYSLVFLFSPLLFTFFLGIQWKESGIYARILSIMLMFEFVSTPLSTIFYIQNKQKLFAKIQFINAFFGAVCIFLGNILMNSPIGSLCFYVANSVIFNLVLIYYSYKFSYDD